MGQFPFGDLLSTFKDLTSKGLRVISESKITGGYSPANLTMQNAAVADGNGTNLDVNDYATAVLEIRGTFVGTINFEGSIDDTNWYPIVATKNDGTNGSTTTTVGLYEVKVATIKSVRARVSGYASGSITVIGKVSPLVNSEKSVQLTGSNVEGTPDVAVPLKANFVAGKYVVTDPAYTDGDLSPLRTNAKGELIVAPKISELVTTLFSSVAIVDTAENLSALISVATLAKYRELYLLVVNSLDNAGHNVALVLTPLNTNTNFVTPANTYIEHTVLNYTSRSLLLTKTELPPLGAPGAYPFKLKAKATVAPTAGSITITLWGVPN